MQATRTVVRGLGPVTPMSPSWRQANALVAERLAARIMCVLLHSGRDTAEAYIRTELQLHLDAASRRRGASDVG